jgi:hypothetical protein
MKKIIIVLGMLLGTLSVYAADGSSGCGPGWYIFKENSLVSSSLRATTNGFLFPSTTIGMTVGSSNCSKHKIVKTEKESLKFATENYYEIATQAAQGEGDFLTSFGSTIGCGQESLDTFKSEMKVNYEKLFDGTSASPEELLKRTYIIILENRELLYSCSLS